MTRLAQDVKLAARRLLKAPGFSLTVVALLALGIGATTSLFSVVDGILLRPLPYPEPERLVFLQETSTGLPEMSVSYLNFLDWQRESRSFQSLAAYAERSFSLSGRGLPERTQGAIASADMFGALGARPRLGRVYTREEDRAGAAPVVVLSEGLWQSRFGGDPSIVGSALLVDDVPHTIVGVLPASFTFPSRASLWVPIGRFATDRNFEDRSIHPGLSALGRLQTGVTLAQAGSEMQRIATDLKRRYPVESTSEGVTLRSLRDALVGRVEQPLLLLFSAVSVLLLITCSNVAGLLLTRSLARGHEMALRVALGARRGHVFRQVLVESLLLAGLGGALGLLVATWGVPLLGQMALADVPRAQEVTVSLPVLAFAAALSMLTGLLFGLAPAREALRVDVNEGLRGGERWSTASPGRARLRSFLVSAQVALTLVLLAGGGLLLRSFRNVVTTEVGFEPKGLLSLYVSLPESRYPDGGRLLAFWRALEERASAIPGVASAALTMNLPATDNSQAPLEIAGRPLKDRESQPWAEMGVVSSAYFETLRIPVLKGRGITADDREGKAPVVVISAGLAQKFFPGEEPLGQRMRIGLPDQGLPFMEVVGVVGDVRSYGLEQDAPPMLYIPYVQVPPAWLPLAARGLALVVRSDAGAALLPALRESVVALDKDLPVHTVRTLTQIFSEALTRRRAALAVTLAFAAAALLLAAVGLYGVLAQSVALRRHEIGIRLALGATSRDVAGLVLGQGLRLVLAGVAAGLALSLALSSLVRSLLVGVTAFDPATFASAALLLLVVALAASLLPIWRANRVDPITALRCE
ncbi:MAG TPA: ABC transporter permease [Vicinamibacteria bacterium]|nr:ABC transporter permease [Vicinamibacteria bacterium]